MFCMYVLGAKMTVGVTVQLFRTVNQKWLRPCPSSLLVPLGKRLILTVEAGLAVILIVVLSEEKIALCWIHIGSSS